MKRIFLIFITIFAFASANAQLQSLEGTEWSVDYTDDDFSYKLNFKDGEFRLDQTYIFNTSESYYYSGSYNYNSTKREGVLYFKSDKVDFKIKEVEVDMIGVALGYTKKYKMEIKGWYKNRSDLILYYNFPQKDNSKTSQTTTNGVVINSITWANTNVGTNPKTFASSPEDYGGYYTWEEAKNACPTGWRLPTEAELKSLVDAGNVWTTQNGKNGRKFGSGSIIIFLPAAGYYDNKGYHNVPDRQGAYWSSTEEKYMDSFSRYLNFNNNNDYTYTNSRDIIFKQSVRCVKK